ncbi:hypothetical protein [Okeania sp. KiyG1]|nr:hypothetical protein [Okeania sp. KiyG1]
MSNSPKILRLKRRGFIYHTKRDKCLLQMVGTLHSPYERRKKEEGRGEKY